MVTIKNNTVRANHHRNNQNNKQRANHHRSNKKEHRAR